MPQDKKCSKCKIIKPKVSFAKSKTTNDNLQYKCKECNLAYRIANKEARNKYFKQRYNNIKDTEQYKKYQMEYYNENKQEINERNRIYWHQNYESSLKEKQAEYSKNNRDKFNEYYRKWYKTADKAKLASSAAKYRALKLQRTPKWLTILDWEKIEEYYIYAKFMTDSLGIRYEVDHIIPLQGNDISGLHVPENLQILSESENCRKRNRYNG